MPDPFVVGVRTDSGAIPADALVVFTVVSGDGILSENVVRTDSRGSAFTRYTLGTTLGTDSVMASIKDNASRFVVFQATSSNFFCPEQEDTFRVTYGTPKDFFLVTQRSSWFPTQGSAGAVRVRIFPPVETSIFTEIPGDFIYDSTIYDAAFSARGDFYVARKSAHAEILKIETNGAFSTFTRLDEYLPNFDLAVELDTNPSGLLVGCDITGPFIVSCPDTVLRFDEARYEAGGINNDALAVDPRKQSEDPLGEDIYFIDTTNPRLLRLPMDSLAVETPGADPVVVTALSQDQADHARGMVCEGSRGDGTIYILVDSDDTKEILQVTTDGTLSVLYNFFDRGPGDAAGQQRDLAIDRGARRLFTLDTRNDNLLVYEILTEFFAPLFDDSTLQATLSNRAGDQLTGGERVGLVILK